MQGGNNINPLRKAQKRNKMKTKILFVATSISLVMFLACGREYQGLLTPKQDENTGKWGYVDTLGKSVIPFKWDTASVFIENLAIVGLNGNYGFIDQKGTEVIPLKYEAVENFSDNLALVRANGKYGYIDKTGKELIPLKYDNAKTFNGGLAEVELDGKIGVINTGDSIVVAFQYKELQYLIGKWALTEIDINTDKNGVFEFKGGLGLSKPGENMLLTFEKEGICISNIKYSDDDIFLNVKSLSFDKNDKWQFDNFVLGQSDSLLFSCNLKLLPQAEKFNYQLRMQEKDALTINVSEAVNRPSRSTEFGVTIGGTVNYNFKLIFKRLESLKK